VFAQLEVESVLLKGPEQASMAGKQPFGRYAICIHSAACAPGGFAQKVRFATDLLLFNSLNLTVFLLILSFWAKPPQAVALLP